MEYSAGIGSSQNGIKNVGATHLNLSEITGALINSSTIERASGFALR
jgi:hypothetical protein